MKMKHWAETCGWGLFLAALLGGCWIVEDNKTERKRLEIERLKLTLEESK